MLTGRGPNGRLRVLYATIVLLRLVSPDQRKIVGCSNRAPSEQAPWSRLGDMPVGERSETRPKRGRSYLTTPNNDGSRHGQDGDCCARQVRIFFIFVAPLLDFSQTAGNPSAGGRTMRFENQVALVESLVATALLKVLCFHGRRVQPARGNSTSQERGTRLDPIRRVAFGGK
jgi:hypothetical protein